MAANIDIKRNSRVSYDQDGYRAERVAIVSGVSGTAAQVLYNAINDAALPDLGDIHPEIADITLQRLDCQPLGGGRFRVVMTYYYDPGEETNQANAEVFVSTTLAVEEQSVDQNGQAMTATYLAGGSLVKQVFTAEVEVPRATLQFEYTAAAVPQDDINTYLGRINLTAWNGYPAGTILCSGIDARQSGTDYRITYSFSYRPDGWQYQGKLISNPYAVNPVSIAPGAPDYAIDLENQTKTFEVYRPAEFNNLGFTIPSAAYTSKLNSGAMRITGSDATLTKA